MASDGALMELQNPLRILITALGGEGGGTLMNWLVAAARQSGLNVQATSVPGVAQRTGATSYYLEMAAGDNAAVFNLVPMPGRVDILLSSELVEAARVIEAGYVSPDRTTLIASHHRVYATAEKISMVDGRYDNARIGLAAKKMAKHCHLLDLQQLAAQHGTYISATLYGALAGSGALPWELEKSRQVLAESKAGSASLAGFDAAAQAIVDVAAGAAAASAAKPAIDSSGNSNTLAIRTADSFTGKTAIQGDSNNNLSPIADSALPLSHDELLQYARETLSDYQDKAYADLYQSRMEALGEGIDTNDFLSAQGLLEAARRLASWMSYEDIARVADLKTRPERFAEVRAECELNEHQIVRITEYLKPRIEEIADILPVASGEKLLGRLRDGKTIPLSGFLGKGRRIPSNAAWGYWMLRLTASMKRWRRQSLRFRDEQQQIENWLACLQQAFSRSPAFALALAELPRVRKGYADTQLRGIRSYQTIMSSIVQPALSEGQEDENIDALKASIQAAFKDEDHVNLNQTVMKYYPPGSVAESSGTADKLGIADPG